jgi:hypothetical protein
MENLYSFNSSPLKAATVFISGEKYVTSKGDVYEWVKKVSGEGDFNFIKESPLDATLDGNCVENLTEVQLKLFWKLCK